MASLSALDVFSVLGRPPDDLQAPKFHGFITPHWETPSFSPLVLRPGETLEREDLRQLEGFFRRHPIRNAALSQVPYFTFFEDLPAQDVAAIRATCAAAGWEVERDPLSIDFLALPMAIPSMPAVRVRVVDTTGGHLPPEYREIIRRNFKADDAYLDRVASAFRTADAQSFTVLLAPGDDAPVAGGTLSIRDGLGFLTWGAVDPHHRHQGLHRRLLSACAAVGSARGAQRCAFTTRNREIRGRWHDCVHLCICRRHATSA
jgi:GNAT superfamily N-acetyltransferase